jgi:hypothetical protein
MSEVASPARASRGGILRRLGAGALALVAAYVVGMVVVLASMFLLDFAARAGARTLSHRIAPGMSVEQVHALVGRAPDRVTGDGAPGAGEDASLTHEWRVGEGRLFVDFRDRLSTRAYDVREGGPGPAMTFVFRVFFWWLPYVFGPRD